MCCENTSTNIDCSKNSLVYGKWPCFWSFLQEHIFYKISCTFSFLLPTRRVHPEKLKIFFRFYGILCNIYQQKSGWNSHVAFMGLVTPMWLPCECPSWVLALRGRGMVWKKRHCMVGTAIPPKPQAIMFPCYCLTAAALKCPDHEVPQYAIANKVKRASC